MLDICKFLIPKTTNLPQDATENERIYMLVLCCCWPLIMRVYMVRPLYHKYKYLQSLGHITFVSGFMFRQKSVCDIYLYSVRSTKFAPSLLVDILTER